MSIRSRCAESGAGLVVLTLLSCGSEPAVVRPNIVVFLLDTVRADAVELDDAGPGITPSLRELAREGVVFTSAFTHTTWTKPAVATLFTSRYPSQHSVRNVVSGDDGIGGFGERLPDELTTLAERLRTGGYRTTAIINQTHLRPKYGFDQGFDEYFAFRGRSAAELNAVLGDWIDGRAGSVPFRVRARLRRIGRASGSHFLYVHYLDPHWPYLERVAELREELGSVEIVPEPPLRGEDVEPWLEQGLSEEDLRALSARYLHGVASTDRFLGFALARLRRAGLLDDTVVVVTSDHGEGLYEHGRLLHGFAPYEEVHRIPLLIRLPERFRTEVREVSAPVGLVDILPTLLELAGLPADEGDMGRSLLPLIRGTDGGGERPIFSETEGIRSWRTSRWKLIRYADGRQELFDLAADPLEQSPLPCDRPCSELAEQLTEFVARLEESGAVEQSLVELDDDDLERLRALGYLND